MKRIVEKGAGGQRLDRYLKRVYDMPNSLVQRLLRTKKIRVVGVQGRVEGGSMVEDGQELILPAWLQEKKQQQEQQHEDSNKGLAEVGVAWQDEECVVVDKPRGMAMHGGTKQRREDATMVHVLRAMGYSHGVHRLDALTSGALLSCSSRRAAHALSLLWPSSSRSYLAISHPFSPLVPLSGTISFPLLQGPASTDYLVLSSSPLASLVLLTPLSGRKHQIRIHLANLGFPLLGDARYGSSAPPPHYLHSHHLSCLHPTLPNRRINVRIPPPPAFLEKLDILGLSLDTEYREGRALLE